MTKKCAGSFNFTLLSNCPHILKMCNANFSNWYLELKNEGGCLVLLYTLQNKAEPEVCRTVKKFLKSNNYVRNRDRQDPRAVLKIFNEDLTERITSIGFITSNCLKTYPNIVKICVGSHSYLCFF